MVSRFSSPPLAFPHIACAGVYEFKAEHWFESTDPSLDSAQPEEPLRYVRQRETRPSVSVISQHKNFLIVGDRTGLLSFCPVVPPEIAKEEERTPLPSDTVFDEYGYVHTVAHVESLHFVTMYTL